MYIEKMIEDQTLVRILEIMEREYETTEHSIMDRYADYLRAVREDPFINMYNRKPLELSDIIRRKHSTISLYSEPLNGGMARINFYPKTKNKDSKMIDKVFVALDGKTYVKICDANQEVYYVNDFGLTNKVVGYKKSSKIISEEKTRVLDNMYTKYMLWANFDNREQFYADFIRNQISVAREQTKDLPVEDRKQIIAEIKKDATEYLDGLTKQIVDQYMLSKFFTRIERETTNSIYERVDKYVEPYKMYFINRQFSNKDEKNFYCSHEQYFINLLQQNFREYNEFLGNLKEQNYPLGNLKIIDKEDIIIAVLGTNLGNCSNKLTKEMIFDKSISAVKMNELVNLPFSVYEEAFYSIYGGGKAKEEEQTRQ